MDTCRSETWDSGPVVSPAAAVAEVIPDLLLERDSSRDIQPVPSHRVTLPRVTWQGYEVLVLNLLLDFP